MSQEVVDILRLAFLDVGWAALHPSFLLGVPEHSSSGRRRPIKLLKAERGNPNLRFEMDLSDPDNTILYLGERRFDYVVVRGSAVDALGKLIKPEGDYSGMTERPAGHA